MGKFTYNTILKADFEDRVLRHLQVVIGAKMRRGESFQFSWKDDVSIGDGRTSVWIHPDCSLIYRYDSRDRQSLNAAWVDALMSAANSTGGLRVTAEPSEFAVTPEQASADAFHHSYE